MESSHWSMQITWPEYRPMIGQLLYTALWDIFRDERVSPAGGTETQRALYSWPVRNSSKTQFSRLSLGSNEWSIHRILAQCIENGFQPKYSKWLGFRESLIQQCTNNGNQLLMLYAKHVFCVMFALCAMSEFDKIKTEESLGCDFIIRQFHESWRNQKCFHLAWSSWSIFLL